MPDVQSLLSPNGKVHALLATNRLLVLDSVSNLREVRTTLYEEEASIEGNIVPRPFPLQYARASEVAQTLRDLLGLDAKKSGPKSPEQMQMEMQRQQMAMQMRQNRGDKKKAAPQKKVDVYIVVDRRQNVILANAPPDKMKIIERAIEILDVPSGRGTSLAGNLVRMNAYRLVSLDPEVTVRMLTEVGDLDPHTRLTVDSKNKSIIAYATVADHLTIQSVIDKLDGVGRELEVIWLRRLRADEVAGTLQYLIVGEKKDKQNDYDYGWSWYGRRNKKDDGPESEFRVDADVENNRLLLWANDLEMGLVRKLLAKLGEIPGASSDPRTVRVMHALSTDETERVLDDLKRAWKGVAPNPIFIDRGPREHSPDGADEAKTGEVETPTTGENETPTGRTTGIPRTRIRFAQLSEELERDRSFSHDLKADLKAPTPLGISESRASPEDGGGGFAAHASAPPVVVTVTADGRLVFSCDDPAVLDRLEELYTNLAPPVKDCTF